MTLCLRSAPSWLRAATLGVAVAAAWVPAELVGQTGCQFVEPTRSAQSATIPGQGQVWYLGGPTFRCADGVRIQADTAMVYVAQNLTILNGNVRFRDTERMLTSDQARYFTRVGRLQAEGHLILRDTVRGSVIENGELVYLRKTEQRPQEQITVVTGVDHVRPLATLYMRPAADSVPPVEDAVPGVTPELAPDSAAALDSTVVLDSTLAPDSTVAPDSIVVSDSAVAGDSAVAPDSAVAANLLAAADTTRPRPDSLVTPDPLPLDTARALAPDPTPPLRQAAPATPPTPEDTVQVPYQVEADNIFLQGDQYFLAWGTVYIVRDSLYARADSVEYDQVAGRMLLHQDAHVETSSYELQGRDINIGMVGGEMRTVRAVREAELVGDDLKLNAPVILLFLTDGAPERLVAIPMRADPETGEEPDTVDRVRPVAQAEQFRLNADSLEVLAPGDVLERIFATGKARGDSSARDSLNVESLPDIARTDWLEGDTVIAFFVKAPPPDPDLPPDTTRDEYQLDKLVAIGAARSLYRLLPSDTASQPGVDAPAVHYVTGASITITMVDGEVDLMEVDGPTQGWHLEPEKRVARADSLPPDSTGVPPDTSGVAPDTTGIVPDTTGVVPDTIPVRPDTVSAAGTGRSPTGSRGPRPSGDDGSGVEDAALPAAAFRGRGRERRSRR